MFKFEGVITGAQLVQASFESKQVSITPPVIGNHFNE
jgi:hypothetical protein